MNGSPKKVAEDGRERSTKFLMVVLGSLETKIIFFILEALICLIAFIAIPALGGSRKIILHYSESIKVDNSKFTYDGNNFFMNCLLNHLRNQILCWTRKKVSIVYSVDFGVLLSIFNCFRKNVNTKNLIIENKATVL